MKNKGFTLIELLAVIVILALIALVTIPMINNVIEKAKKGALEDSVYGLKSAAELYYSTTGTSETIEFDCTEEGCISGDKKLPFKGTVNEGKVKLFSDGKVSICLTEDGYGASILADEKKVTTKMGGCDEETYKVSEVIAIEKYNEVNEENKEIKNALYNKTLISSKDLSKDNIVTEINNIDLNESEAANKKIIVDSLKYSELGITEDMSWEEIGNKLLDMYPELPLGTTYNFAYTGGIQEWTAPSSGVYKLEVWGAQGGNAGGKGGYSLGYKTVSKGTKFYIVIGGAGKTVKGNVASGGYNGGGNSNSGYSTSTLGGGGGATHIATLTGTLLSLSGNVNKILIVAGGGGGATSFEGTYPGGTGGGTAGGGAYYKIEAGDPLVYYTGTNSFGIGGQGNKSISSGGGGGYYGGSAYSGTDGSVTSGCGGTGYVGGVPKIEYNGTTYTPATSNGVNSGNGKAVITYIAS